VAGVTLVAVTTALLLPFRSDTSRAGPALVLVLPGVLIGILAGRTAAVVSALGAAAALNLVFIPPYGTLKIDAAEDIVALVVFVAVAVVVGALVAATTEGRRAAEAHARELEAVHDELSNVAAERQHLAEEKELLTEEAGRAEVLERIDEQRRALVRSVSHDLRTPLAIISAAASDLRSGPDYPPEDRDELLDTINEEAQRLDRLVANLLSMSRIEAGAYAPERQAFSLDELVAASVDRLRPLFRQVRLQVDVPGDLPLIDGDYSQIDQVVSNLLENAARHAPPASTVWVSASARDGDVRLLVRDEGVGVPDQERDQVFEPFFSGRGSGSTGVGLAICRAVVEAHGGSIDIERTPGGGATFVVMLPVHRG
jgi:two-component system sensor histidine kinase KdpD